MSHEAYYRFLPWARRGLQPAYPDTLTGRIDVEGSLPVTVNVGASDVAGSDLETRDATVDLRLYGPGDVLGIDRRQVIRTVPTDGTRDFEPNYFPSVEFARPDLAWLFSPARAVSTVDSVAVNRPWRMGQNLRPWLSLVVVPESAATLKEGGTDTEAVAQLTVDSRELPSPAETWAWAHVQVVGGQAESDVFDPEWITSQLTQRSSLATCRLVCPRELEADGTYVACVVPTFDAGREAGLGREPLTGEVGPAWGDADGPVTLPVYYLWRFGTGPAGDFESLVDRLHPTFARPGVGYGNIDIQEPLKGRETLKAIGDDPTTISLGGALKSTEKPATTRSYPADKRVELQELLDKGIDDDGIPIVGPPVYGQWQAGASLPDSDEDAPPWLHQLNVDPENRAVAGLGAKVVRDNQEQLMDQAWDQVGQLREANQTVNQGVLGTLASDRLHEDLTEISTFDLKRLARPFHDRITVSPDAIRSLPGEHTPNQTVGEFLDRGPAPTSVLSPRFAGMTRRGSGPGHLVGEPGTTTPGSFAEAIDAGELSVSGLSAVGGGRPLPNDVADAIEVVIEERGKLAEERAARHDERIKEIDTLWEDLTEVHLELEELSRSLEAAVVLEPTPGRTVGSGRSSAGERLRTHGRISVLRERGLTTPAAVEVETDDDVAVISSVLTDLTVSDLETSFSPRTDRVLLDVDRLGGDLERYRDTLETSVENVARSMALREYADTMDEVDTVVDVGLGAVVTAVRTRPESFDDPDEVRAHVARLDETLPLLESLRDELEASSPPTDRVAEYYQRVWNRHFEASEPPQVVSVSPTTATAADRTVQSDILTALDPATTVRDRIQSRLAGIDLPPTLPDTITLHPTFDQPMYEPLVETALRYFLPGVGDIPNNSLTLLETNSQFIESYLVGLNHEFARELRWREFPTDMRGTYFDQFWDTTVQTATSGEPPADIDSIHTWQGVGKNELGDHLQTHLAGAGGEEGEMLVLIVRGDLLKRYPNTHIYVERGEWIAQSDDVRPFTESTVDEHGDPVVRTPITRMTRGEDGTHSLNSAYEARYPVFSGTIAPDITFLGLPLTAEEARGSHDYADGDAGWFVVLEEPIGESRFGLDAAREGDGEAAEPAVQTWDELAWHHVTTENGHLSLAATLDSGVPFFESAQAHFGRNSAHLAHITWQRPVRVAVHADDMLPTEDLQ